MGRNVHTRFYSFFIILFFLFSPFQHSSSQTTKAISLTFVLSTTSDWTSIKFQNLNLLNCSYNFVTGKDAPQLMYDFNWNEIYVYKKSYDETNVTIEIVALIEPNATQGLLIEKGAIGETTLGIFHEGIEIAFISCTPMKMYYDLAYLYDELKSDLREVSIRRALERPMVLAFYYPWYGNPMCSSGMEFHWEDVTYQDIGTSRYYPLLGPYDSQDERLIEAHIKLAKASGIDGFISSWWGIDTFEDRSLKRIMNIANGLGFSITIYYESVREMDQNQVVSELSYVLRNYANEPSFLKIEGRPVIFLYAIQAYYRDARFWQQVVGRVKESTNTDVLFIADTTDVSFRNVFDAFHKYIPIWGNGTHVWETLYENADKAREARFHGRISVTTVYPGNDDRKVRKPGTYFDREDGGRYDSTWISAIDSYPDMVLICSWNEWHEGTNIEQAREFEFKYLTLTKHWVEAYKNIPTIGLPHAIPVLNMGLLLDTEALELRIQNGGDGDAFAINILLDYENARDLELSGVTYLPVNGTCMGLFIPLVRANEIYSLEVPFHSDGGAIFTAYAFYYSSNGEKRYVTTGTTYSTVKSVTFTTTASMGTYTTTMKVTETRTEMITITNTIGSGVVTLTETSIITSVKWPWEDIDQRSAVIIVALIGAVTLTTAAGFLLLRKQQRGATKTKGRPDARHGGAGTP